MTETSRLPAGLALAGGALVLASALLVVLAFELPGLVVGLDAEALRAGWFDHGPAVPRILYLAWSLAAGALALVGGSRMAAGDAAARPGFLAVAGGLLALPVLGSSFMGAQAAVLGGALHVAARRDLD